MSSYTAWKILQKRINNNQSLKWKCPKKKWQAKIVVDQDGYPIHKRRNDGKYIEKNHVALDNRYVVPYNPNLLLKCQTHLNIEWCNQSTSI